MTNELKTPIVSQEVKDLVAQAIAGVKAKPFSERHPELGKMIKCQVCLRRHRDSIKCEQKFVYLHTLEDVETGELTDIFRTAIRPDIHNEAPYLKDRQATAKQVMGAKAFAKKRKKPRPNATGLQIVELVKKLYGDRLYDPESEEDRTLLNECRIIAASAVKDRRRRVAMKRRRRQDVSRRINHGLLVPGTR